MVKEKLIKARKERNFSQQDIAEHLKISQTHYLRKKKVKLRLKTKNGNVSQNYWT